MIDNHTGHEETSATPFQQYCVRMLSGPVSGKTWPLLERVTLIGRNLGCHVRIDDPRVSRVQAELHQDSVGIRLRSVGKKNPTCVNGVAREEVLLSPGDLIAISTSTLIVDIASTRDLESATTRNDARTTQSLAGAIHLRDEFDRATYEQDSNLTGDLHRLLGLLRTLGRAESLDALIEQLTAHVRERLTTEAVWVGWRLRLQDDLVLFPPSTPEETRAAPFEVMREACADGAGILSTHANHAVVAAPLIHGGEPFGAIAARHGADRGPFSENDLHYLVAVAECCAPLIRAAERLEQMQRDTQSNAPMVAYPNQMHGSSPATQALHAEIRRAAVARTNIILQGETGVGKELSARMLHDLSARHTGPYVVVNSASLSPELFESEMFGHERGAFTGATQRRKGLFELAHGGTLFLDEVAELSLANQAHLLRVVESGTFRPIGSEKELRVDVRIICATNRPLPDPGQTYFRTDLYHRLAGIVIRIKPLRERREEIPSLADHFLDLVAPHAPTHPKGFTQEATDKLMAYDWPGNIRELRNVVERACFMTQAEYLSSGDLCIEDARHAAVPAQGIISLDELERQHLLDMLRLHQNSAAKVAVALGLSRSALYYKLTRHGIKPRDLAE